MKVENRPIAEVRPYAGNPRKNKAAIDKVAASIREFGWRQPIVVDTEMTIVVGHTRYEAAKVLGLTEVPVHVAEGLTPAQVRAYRLADNRLHEDAEWDEDLLRIELAGLDASDFDLGLTGFADDELSRLLGEAVDDLEESGVGDDQVPEPPEVPVSKPGDLWVLGDHRLLCGSSTNPDDVARLMAGQKAALFATDPPYLIDYTGADRPNDSGKDWTDTYREIDIEDGEQFFRALFSTALGHLEDNAAWYCWHAHKRAALIEKVWAGLGVLNHQQIVWVKPSALHSYSFFPWRHEPCLMGWKQGNKPAHDGDNSHAVTSVWELDWEGNTRPVGNEHPTQKPLEVFAIPMRKHTQPGDICYEPFSGSGSQLIAGERLGRKVYAMEISPAFVDVAVKRWQEATGKEAVLEGAGATFESVAFERLGTAQAVGATR